MKQPSARARRARGLRRLRAWVALRLQARRRRRGGTPAAPLITAGYAELGTTEADWFDVVLEFSFEHGKFPAAQLEVWLSRNGAADELVSSIASDLSRWRHARVTQSEDALQYKLRYVNGTVTGPFSNVQQVTTVL